MEDTTVVARKIRLKISSKVENVNLPTRSMLRSLQKDYSVKVIDDRGERFWVRLVRRCPTSRKEWIGVISNHLVGGQEYKFGDFIVVNIENIISIENISQREEIQKLLQNSKELVDYRIENFENLEDPTSMEKFCITLSDNKELSDAIEQVRNKH